MEQSIDKKMRISDQLILNNADMNGKYYVIVQKPDHMFNTKYAYTDAMNDVESKIKDLKVIYPPW